MPNWCENYLEVSGPAESLRGFRECVRYDDPETGDSTPLSLEQLWPTPPALLDKEIASRLGTGVGRMDSGKRGFPSWYTWRISHWGTKWDISWESCSLSEDDAGLTYRFQTAWSPPTAWLRMVGSEMFTDLEFRIRYVDEGFLFAGWTVIHGEDLLHGDSEMPDFEGADDESEVWDFCPTSFEIPMAVRHRVRS